MPDYMYLLESRLSPEQRVAALRVQELAQSQAANLYLTGGAVRDLVSGMPIRDLDFTVEGNPARIVRELEKGGARVVHEDESLRHADLVFAGDVDGSISAARDHVYDRPGGKAQVRWSGIMEDLRRRDFSINAVAISLNPHSRGLLLDPNNGLADLERQEVRALSIHAFTNQPIRLMRILRFCARLGFKMESRTAEWFELAMLRELHKTLSGEQVDEEVRQLGREDHAVAILKAWEARGLLTAIHPQLQKRKPHYDGLGHLAKVRETMASAGVRPRLSAAVMHYVMKRLKPRDRHAMLREMKFRPEEIESIDALPEQAHTLSKLLAGRKMNNPLEAYGVVHKAPADVLAFVLAEHSGGPAAGKIRNYLQKWQPLRMSLPVAELEALGVERGPKFDQVIEKMFAAQLRGRGRLPEERTKLLRQLAGIKDTPPRKSKEEKRRGRDKTAAALEHRGPAAVERTGRGKAGGAAASGKAPAPAPAVKTAEKPVRGVSKKIARKPVRRPSKPKGRAKTKRAAKKHPRPKKKLAPKKHARPKNKRATKRRPRRKKKAARKKKRR